MWVVGSLYDERTSSHGPIKKSGNSNKAVPIPGDVLKYTISGDNLQFVNIEFMPGEMIYSEAGSMVYMSGNVRMETKATGGVFIIDDLGRQSEPPQKIVNRWIVPLEESRDILALQSGEKFEVPFDTLVIFSTNFHPNQIFDKAALRRIFFKIKIDGPNQENFLKIFALVAKKKKMPLDERALLHLLKVKYPTINNEYANYQPVFLIDQMIAICNFEGIPYQMSPELIDRAWANMFVKEEKIVH